MHNGLIAFTRVILLASMIVTAGCNPTTGGGASFSVTPCGGDVVGVWHVRASCLRFGGTVDLSTLVGVSCTSGAVSVSGDAEVLGTLTATSEGRFTDATHTNGNLSLRLPDSCLMVGSDKVYCDNLGGLIQGAGFLKVMCIDPFYDATSIYYGGRETDPDGNRPWSGLGCTCSASINYSGGLGAVSSSPPVNSTYTVSNNEITLSGDGVEYVYPYCVQGNQLTLSPPNTFGSVVGSVVFDKV